VLDESLPVIHAALTQYFGFSDAEAEAFKDTLAIWFHRVVRRCGGRLVEASELRQQLIFVACKYARAFQIAKSEYGSETLPPQPPEEVAVALLNRLNAGTTHL
jgi:hypothetical protein